MNADFWKLLLDERNNNQKWFEKRFLELDFPELYLGDEMNTFHFDWDRAITENTIEETFRIALLNMAASRQSFSAPAISLFYELLHAYDPSWVIERSLCPPTPGNRIVMKNDGIRPFAVESKMPLPAFDVVCLSMGLTLSAVNVPWLILESGIPLHSKDRFPSDPFVILGGSALVNPGPFLPFCDLLFFGEGEDILPELLSMIQKGKRDGLSRDEILMNAVCRWDCLLAPCFYEERFSENGRFTGTFPLNNKVPEHIRFSKIPDLNKTFIPSRPFLNFSTYTPHSSHFEISRGCEGKCSFCMPGFTTLPFRPRNSKLVLDTMDKLIYETGNTAMSPVSFNSVSHPEINEIIRDMSSIVEDRIRLISLRMDDFISNPELCCFISMQKRGRIAFGVEGSSQRLRNLVSKNLSEEQILAAMRETCRTGYSTVKFMMICNLPSETKEDLEELYQLAVKIHDIFEEETLPGKMRPWLLISWNTLHVSPHTPLQWTGISHTILPEYAEFTDKIKALGFSTFTPSFSADDVMSQLILRGDSRLSKLLEYLARNGEIKHNAPYSDDVVEKTVHFLSDNSLPSIDEWFRAYTWEDAFPWDIVESPASKEYLYKRYLTLNMANPKPDPICSESCSGCGACGGEHQKELRGMVPLREEDRKIDLHHPVRKTDFRPVLYVLMEFEYDYLHSAVIPSYWDCEIRRALFHAGVSFDPDSVESFGSSMFSDHCAAGFNVTGISLGKHYEPEQLKDLIEEHAVNFHVRSVSEAEAPLRVHTVSYRIPLPEDIDAEELSSYIETALGEKEWSYWFYADSVPRPLLKNLRPAVQRVKIQDNYMLITMGPAFTAPGNIYHYLLQLPPDKPLPFMPERIGFTFEKQGIIEQAMSRKTRDAFIRHRAKKIKHGDEEFNGLAAYISSENCLQDLKALIRRDYTMPPPFHYRIPKNLSGRKRDLYSFKGSVKYLLKLIAFVIRDYEGIFSDGLYSFRPSKSAMEFILTLRDHKNAGDYYIIKSDVSNYVSSIVPELIIPKLTELWGDDPAFLDFLKYLLLRRECIEPDGTTVSCEPGGLGGIPLANLFMNVYLMELDDYFYARAPLYCRYSDDIIIFAESLEEAEEFLEHFLKVLEFKKLHTNSEKTQLIAPGDEVDILGFKLKNGKLDISDHSIKKLKHKIRKYANYLLNAKKEEGLSNDECGRRMIQYYDKLFFGRANKHELTWARWLFPVIGDTSSLKELDHYVQNAIRYAMCGSFAKKRYRISYKKLQELGYRSLVNAYYHFKH